MIEVTYDIEDLSLILRTRAKEQPPLPLAPMDPVPEDLSLSVIVDPNLFEEVATAIQLHDTLTNKNQMVYCAAEGYYLRYRVAVLGIGSVVEEVYQQLTRDLTHDLDLELGEFNLWARFQTALFGGTPKSEVVKSDASVLADRLIQFRPNYLVLVNVGQVKEKFADKSPQQLALLTHRINSGAIYSGQRPYTLVFVTDSVIPPKTFSQYWRICQTMNTFPATTQFEPTELAQLAEHSRKELLTYTKLYFQIKHLK
jgi:hypothetical protein